MNYKKENWNKKTQEEQMLILDVEWSRRIPGHKRNNLAMNRIITYTTYAIEDEKNKWLITELSMLLDDVKRFKDNSMDTTLEKRITDEISSLRAKVEQPHEPTWIDILESEFDVDVPEEQITICQYDENDKCIGEFTGLFKETFDSIQGFEKYYYRVAYQCKDTVKDKISDRHFGVKVSSIGGLKFDIRDHLNRYLNYMVGQYAKRKDEDDLWEYNYWYVINQYNRLHKLTLGFEQLDKSEFEREIGGIIKKYSFVEIDDLKTYQGKPGIYLMVLDDYNVCYIGQAQKSIKTRVMAHWSRNNYFTGTGIDLFKAQDTTRLFAIIENDIRKLDAIEHEIITGTNHAFLLNVLEGSFEYLINNGKPLVSEDTLEFEDLDVDSAVQKIKHLFIHHAD